MIKLLVFILAPCFVWGAVNLSALEEYVHEMGRRDKARDEVSALAEEIEKAQRDKRQLEDREFAGEATARERWGLILPGENIIFLKWD